MAIMIDGKPIEHNIGDSIFWITNKEGHPFELYVEEIPNYIDSIRISNKGVEYYSYGINSPINNEDNLFLTYEEAEKWLAEKMPEKLSLKPDDYVFFKGSKLRDNINCGTVEELLIEDDVIKYVAICGNYERHKFTEADLGETVFFSLKEAKEALKRQHDERER